jgi:5'-3' exonuclease
VSDEKRISLLDQKFQQLDEQGVRARMGVPPHLVVDLLALMGDKVEHVAGNNPSLSTPSIQSTFVLA